MKLRAVLPWAVTAVAIGFAIWSLSDRPQPAGPTTVAIDAPPPDAPVPGPDLGPAPDEVTAGPERAAEPEPDPPPAVPTGLELSRGAITMMELQDARTGERFFRVVSKPTAPVRQVEPVALAPEVPPASETVSDEPPLELELETAAEAPAEAPAAPSEEDLRRIVREELEARDEELQSDREAELAAARAADMAQFTRDASLSTRDSRDLQRLLDQEVAVIEQTRAALLRRSLSVSEATRKLDTQRRETERALRSLLGERGYALYHERGIGWVLTGLWTMHTGTREALTSWR